MAPGVTESIILDDSFYSTTRVSCPIVKYIFTEPPDQNQGLTVNCPTPDTSIGCRTVEFSIG